jgi:hypothetical protein
MLQGVKDVFSNIIPGTDPKKRPKKFKSDYKGQKERYEYLHKMCDADLIGRYCLIEIERVQSLPFKDIEKETRVAKKNLENEIDKFNITQEDFYNLFYEEVSKKILDQYLVTKNFELFKILEKFITKKIVNDEENKQKFKLALNSFKSEFEDKLNCVSLHLTNKCKTLTQRVLYAINRNLKYNKDYQVDMINIILTPKLLDNEPLIYDICEILNYSKSISIVVIIIDPIDEKGNAYDNFNFNISNFRMFNSLLATITNNRAIKSLFIQCARDYKLILAPESAKLLIKKILSETLVSFHIGKFTVSENYLNEILFHIKNSRNLKYIGYDNKKIFKYLKSSILPIMQENISLQAIVLTGFSEEDEYLIEDFKKKLKEKKKLAIYCGNETFVKYPFIK